MIQVYGRFDGYFSHAQVSRGIACGLIKNNARIQIHNSDNMYSGYEGFEFEKVDPVGGWNSKARIGFYIGGYPNAEIFQAYMNDHEIKIGLFIAESSIIPKSWTIIANMFDFVLVPSKWTKDVYKKSGVRSKIYVVNHGISDKFAKIRNYFDFYGKNKHILNFLHICGASSFPERKGTAQLIEAFNECFSSRTATLTIRATKTPWFVNKISKCKEGLIRFSNARYGLNPNQMHRFMSYFNFIIQPSRSESYGIVPVEARSIGIPVILTNGTGHNEHIESIDSIIPIGDEYPIKVNGIESGMAPSVSKEAIKDILLSIKYNYLKQISDSYELAKNGYFYLNSWQKKTESLSILLKHLSKKHRERSFDDLFGIA